VEGKLTKFLFLNKILVFGPVCGALAAEAWSLLMDVTNGIKRDDIYGLFWKNISWYFWLTIYQAEINSCKQFSLLRGFWTTFWFFALCAGRRPGGGSLMGVTNQAWWHLWSH
jgi:uncharacterized membrane protein